MRNQIRKIAGGTLICLTATQLTSCVVLEDPALATAVGAAGGAVIGNQIGGGRGALIGGVAGGALGYMISKNYVASQNQKNAALAAGKRASYRSSIKDSKARYVAVPVSKKEGSGKDVMIYDKEKKKLANEKAYVPSEGTKYSSGQVINVGGRSAVVANSFVGV